MNSKEKCSVCLSFFSVARFYSPVACDPNLVARGGGKKWWAWILLLGIFCPAVCIKTVCARSVMLKIHHEKDSTN